MKITIDGSGRLVIPKALREQAQLQAGSWLEVTFRDGAIILEPFPLEVELREEGGLLVARPSERIEALDPATVNGTLDILRNSPSL